MFEFERPSFDANISGTAETRAMFWERMRTVPHPCWPTHPVQHRDLTFAIPVSVHGDEVPISGIGKQWAKKMLNVSWSSLTGNKSTKSSQYWSFALIEKTGIAQGPRKTVTMMWKILAWSLRALWSGYWPTTDYEGRERRVGMKFPTGTLQACKAGQPLAKGFFGVCWAVLGDLDYYVAGLNLPSYNNSNMPCSLCRCSLSGPATWSNFTAGAPWRATMWTPETWHAWEGKSTNPLFQEVPGMSVLQVCCDYMHSKYLGTDMVQFGSILMILCFELMHRTPEDNLMSCWRHIREYYRIHNTPVRFRSMTRLTMFVRKSGGPKLRGKAAEIRHFAEVLLSLWQSQCDNTQLLHRKITLLLKKNVMMERLMTEHRDKLFFEDDEARAFEEACSDMLLLHADLAKCYAGLGKQYFSLTSKTHMLQHAALLSKCLSPRLVWCFVGEDFQQKAQRLASMSLKGNTGVYAVNKMFRHYRLGLSLLFDAAS
ncbi:unnamed protein product [Symbiodinium natans]|uniref:Uncharacterized protein n=1 Tax=Symbiodinium natans TaxID=878477 RepID=A0A812NFL0_9DINO|nr:unnamed protein product [Symbiodinium natans]